MQGAIEKAVADIGSDQADLDPSTDRYARRFAGPTGEWLLSVQTHAVRKLIASWKGGTVLDVGGGHGQIARPLLEDGHPVTVLSSTETAFGQAAKIEHASLTRTTGNLMDPPFADQSFDVVTAVRMMAHVGDWQRFVAGLTRIARHAVIVDFPVPGGANALEPLLFGLKKRLEGDTRRFATMTKAEVRAAFTAHGFKPQGEIGQFVLPMVVHRKLKVPGISGALEGGLSAIGLARAMGTPVVMAAIRG